MLNPSEILNHNKQQMKKIYTILFIVSCTVNGALAQTLWAWGGNQHGQVGNSTTNSSGQKTRIQISTDNTWIDIDGGYQHSVALKSDGTIWAWGYNDQGEIGDNSTTDAKTPIQIGIDSDWTDVEAGYQYTMALKSDGSLWIWGSCDAVTSKVPLQFGTASDWAKIAGGWNHSYGIKKDGTLWAWGAGRLGDGVTTSSKTAVAIGTDLWSEIAAGENYSIGIKADGTIWGWGISDYGQAGTTGGYKSVPTQIGTDANWSKVTAGQKHTVAIKTDGSMWSWGSNGGTNNLGDGTNISSRNTPGQIGTATDWDMAAAGNSHTMALKKDGTLWAFGYNGVGPLGDNTLFVAEMPTQIGTDKWSKVAVGTAHTLAIGTSTTAGVNDFTATYGVNAYPNPNSGKFYLTAPDVLKGKMVLVTDMLGAPVSTFEIVGETTEVTGSLSSGVYFLKAENTFIKIVVD